MKEHYTAKDAAAFRRRLNRRKQHKQLRNELRSRYRTALDALIEARSELDGTSYVEALEALKREQPDTFRVLYS